MESSEEDDDFPFIESITPQSKIDSLYQSHTEKVCFLLPNVFFFLFKLKWFKFWSVNFEYNCFSLVSI
jgi:hypothetical protein